MNLSPNIISKIKELGGKYSHKSVDVSDTVNVNFQKLPDSYYDLVFCIEWPETCFSQPRAEEKYVLNWDDYDDLFISLNYVRISLWGYKLIKNVNTLENHDNFGSNKYILIGNLDDNYYLVIDLKNLLDDGDVLVNIIDPYDSESEHIRYSERFSSFLDSLILNQEPPVINNRNMDKLNKINLSKEEQFLQICNLLENEKQLNNILLSLDLSEMTVHQIEENYKKFINGDDLKVYTPVSVLENIKSYLK